MKQCDGSYLFKHFSVLGQALLAEDAELRQKVDCKEKKKKKRKQLSDVGERVPG